MGGETIGELIAKDPMSYVGALAKQAKPSTLKEQMDRIIDGCGVSSIFVGPYASSVANHPYVTLTSYGIKAEGEPYHGGDGPTIWTQAEAVYRFKQVLRGYLGSVVRERAEDALYQFAWRRFPAVETGDDDDYRVSARCVLIDISPTDGR